MFATEATAEKDSTHLPGTRAMLSGHGCTWWTHTEALSSDAGEGVGINRTNPAPRKRVQRLSFLDGSSSARPFAVSFWTEKKSPAPSPVNLFLACWCPNIARLSQAAAGGAKEEGPQAGPRPREVTGTL